jgi:Fe-S-cluster containining protein
MGLFYEEGLRFECTRCSRCCRHVPGYVFLTRQDFLRLQGGTALSAATFFELYCREITINGLRKLSLKEKANYDCIFWEDGGCSVYERRPFQCRSYPFWTANLSSREEWERLSSSCPGIGQGPLHGRAEIEAWLHQAERQQQLRSRSELISPESPGATFV